MKKIKKRISILLIMAMMSIAIAGCGKSSEEESNDNVLSDNIVITETGEVIEKVPQPTEAVGEMPTATQAPEVTQEPETTQAPAEGAPTPEIIKAEVELEVPTQEQVITEEDQIEPTGSELQIVFLGDSIFDTHRDGTGVPYLTAVQCEADVYNLAIGGTSATLESGEENDNAAWDSQSLVGVVKAMKGEITTDSFAGTRTKEILDNKNIDWSVTDYFVVEYGMNDFFRGVPLDNSDNWFDVHTYAGALRYAASNLGEIAHDATIIFCGPNYAQFFRNNQFIGDGNTLNTGYGTLFDYKGICQYVANEYQTHFLDAYLELGIDGYTAKQYLEDGVHLTAEGRQLYADALAKMILKIEETKNN